MRKVKKIENLLGFGEFLRQYLLKDKDLSGWREDKEKFKIDLVNDIKDFLFSKWEKPWKPALLFDSNGDVINSFRNVNGRFYRNLRNLLSLENKSGKSPYFVTLFKVKEQDGTITNEDKITSIVSYVPRYKPGKKVKEGESRKPDWMQPKFHSVINVDFVNGIKKPEYKATKFKELELNQYVESFIAELSKLKRIPKLIYDQSDQCYYVSNPPLYTTDEIHLVQINAFKGIGEYYSTLFHEITHSTKSANKLGHRDKKNKKKLDYANEELVAEMGAMIVCTELGLEYNRQNSLTYLKGWLSQAKKATKNIDDILIEAYSFACDAAEYLIKDIDLEKLVPDTMQERAELEVEELEKDSKILFDNNSLKVINHFTDERVKLFFKIRPDKAMLATLKKVKYRYAPTARAWQKRNTEENIKEILEIAKQFKIQEVPGIKQKQNKLVKSPKIKTSQAEKLTRTSTKKLNIKKTMEKKSKRTKVENTPDWLYVIRKFIRMANKENSQEVLRRLLKEIQSKFTARKKTKTTPYISLIRRIQDTIVDQVNRNIGKKNFELKVPKMFVSLLKQASATVIISKQKKTKVTKKSLSGIKKKTVKRAKKRKA